MEILIVLAVICFLPIGIILLLDSGKGEKVTQNLRENGVPENAGRFFCQGGHPDLPKPALVYMWREDANVKLARLDGKDNFKVDKVIAIPVDSIRSLSLQGNVQHMSGGASVGGAVVGGMIAGPVGAVIGSNAGSKGKTVDHSLINLVVDYHGMEMQLVFLNDPGVYARMAAILGTR